MKYEVTNPKDMPVSFDTDAGEFIVLQAGETKKTEGLPSVNDIPYKKLGKEGK